MHFDFTLILVIATLVSGLVVLADKLWLKKRRQQAKPQPEEAGMLVDYSTSFFPVLALVLVLRAFLFEPFQIPSGSMLPTLKIGDFIVVNKFSYGLRLPVVNSKILPLGTPKSGDVAVFRYPLDERLNYIKRIIATPGDKVSFRNNVISLNGKPVDKKLLAFTTKDLHHQEAPNEQLWQETLNERSYQIYHQLLPHYDLPEIEVPEGYYLVMGDNRDHSSDSRFWCQNKKDEALGCFNVPSLAHNLFGRSLVVGLVAEEQLVGKATAVWMHWPTFFSLPKFNTARLID